MSIFEYDEEREMKLIRQAEREVGWEEGHKDGWENGLAEGRIAGHAEGHAEGKAEGIRAFISLCEELGLSREETIDKLISKFSLSAADATHYIEIGTTPAQ